MVVFKYITYAATFLLFDANILQNVTLFDWFSLYFSTNLNEERKLNGHQWINFAEIVHNPVNRDSLVILTLLKENDYHGREGDWHSLYLP